MPWMLFVVAAAGFFLLGRLLRLGIPIGLLTAPAWLWLFSMIAV